MLSYKNDDDKCYGAAGMAISLVVLDGDDMLSAVNVDADSDKIMEFGSEYYFNGIPGLSARSVWGAILKKFDYTTSMAIGNVLCRALVLEHEPLDNDRRDYLHDCIVKEAEESCSLEPDEAEALFNKRYTYFVRVFSHHGVQDIVRDFVRQLRSQRRLTHLEVVDGLRALGML